MKSARNGLFAFLVVAYACVAHASFSYSLEGPDSVREGQKATFEFEVTYSPYDIALQSDMGGNAFYRRLSASTTAFLSLYKEGVYIGPIDGALDPFPLSIYGSARADGSVLGDFDLNKAFEREYFFSLAFDDPGSYTIQVGGRNWEELSRNPTAQCYALAATGGCLPGLVSDGIDFSDGFTRTLQLTVSAIPEPETYSMMLVGLGLIGAIARRRKPKMALSTHA